VNFKKLTMAFAVAGAMLAAGNAEAVNWLKLQGTEGPGSGGRAKVWGFLQPTYQHDSSPGTAPEPTRIGPNLQNQDQFQLLRARIGVRGTALPLDDDINYFIMAEFGKNGATDGGIYGQRTPTRLMDASVTVSKIRGARVRFGLFKTPGAEEIYQGIATFDYINLTWVSNQLLMERYGQLVAPNDGSGGSGYEWNSSVGGARDTGVQVFDWFKSGDWEHSYAIMIGNGHGLEGGQQTFFKNGGSGSDVNIQSPGHDIYAYWSSELVYGGKGPFQQGWKTFVWGQSGKRYFDTTDNGTVDGSLYDRTRYGIGTRYRRGNWRVAAEYMTGKGMIFQGPEKPNFVVGAYSGVNGESNGYYGDVGYYIPGTNWEADLRYDVYHRSTESAAFAADFFRTTVGAQYHFNKKTRLLINYEARSADAPGPAAPPPFKANLAQIGNRYGIQITTIF
jgi:hypothetical protein